MIKSISIQNFQSHEHSKLDFSPGVNCIVGSSDSGKTAIIRALRWGIWNRPSGNSIRSTWGGDTFVSIETEEGYVLRFKGKTDKYELKLNGEASSTFKAFGTSVPQEVITFLNINEINLQSQLDSPFLLSDTPGGVAAHFNRVARLDKIDEASSRVNSLIRTLASDLTHTENQIRVMNVELVKFEHLEKFEVEVEVLEEMEQLFKNVTNARIQLQRLTARIEKTEDTIAEASMLLKLETKVASVIKLITQREELKETKTNILVELYDIEENDEKQKKWEQISTLEPLVKNILDKITDMNGLRKDSARLDSMINTILSLNKRTLKTQESVLELEEAFHKEMGSVCILCGQSIKQK